MFCMEEWSVVLHKWTHLYIDGGIFLESVLNCVLFLRKNNNNQVSHIFSSCFVSQLAKHMEKCNSKPQPLPEYIKENINVIDSNVEEIKVNLGTLSDEELLAIISRVSKIHSGGCRHLLKVKKKCFLFHLSRGEKTAITKSIFIHALL